MIQEPISCLSVVVPAYNEESTLAVVVQKLLALPYLREIVIVDDCSSDRTIQIAESLSVANSKVRVTRHQTNSGKVLNPLKVNISKT